MLLPPTEEGFWGFAVGYTGAGTSAATVSPSLAAYSFFSSASSLKEPIGKASSAVITA